MCFCYSWWIRFWIVLCYSIVRLDTTEKPHVFTKARFHIFGMFLKKACSGSTERSPLVPKHTYLRYKCHYWIHGNITFYWQTTSTAEAARKKWTIMFLSRCYYLFFYLMSLCFFKSCPIKHGKSWRQRHCERNIIPWRPNSF